VLLAMRVASKPELALADVLRVLPLSPPTMQKYLRHLSRVGLVATRPSTAGAVYSLTATGVELASLLLEKCNQWMTTPSNTW